MGNREWMLLALGFYYLHTWVHHTEGRTESKFEARYLRNILNCKKIVTGWVRKKIKIISYPRPEISSSWNVKAFGIFDGWLYSVLLSSWGLSREFIVGLLQPAKIFFLRYHVYFFLWVFMFGYIVLQLNSPGVSRDLSPRDITCPLLMCQYGRSVGISFFQRGNLLFLQG